ncbi:MULTISPECIES: hypothetical protein [unclassified Arthrobacter]|uniref:hypothetical protein n=1 Tax=unclassified Arthrobacter TaxID=235627 RepID=UPI001D152D3D|nr:MULTISPECIES: hypothetical protein [unclassified Arthrobacter]MCC3276529.1 hypothetical protein [Arthrobacter sp. zg-Y20]MCC3279943.1 hypothetical protein [Arthrobacter sp. zg-Y40]MCC9178306.1 hypothetical protein [Arthrobacter sp. zg-Y750]MDK1316689.1 hypothetical protein [Arthrobacter sp. zg.Y20]WIB06888.1 hypothetical protein QNO06_03915 [Arthrobacter sp. zg-Y20]
MAIGRFFGSLFGNTPEPVAELAQQGDQPPSGPDAEHRETVRSLVNLRTAVRRAGAALPPMVSSMVRQIDDILAPLLEYVGSNGASTEQRVLLNAIITNYLPTPLRAYVALNDRERTDDSEATALLVEQLTILEGIARDLENQVRTGAIAELSTHGRFLDDKFSPSSLTFGEQ